MVLERSRPTEQASSSSSSSLGATKADLGWSPSLWRDFRCEQLPDYPDAAALAAAEENICGSFSVSWPKRNKGTGSC